jgi:Fic family protein
MDEFTSFKKDYPTLNMKELAVKFKERKDKMSFVENLSENEATAVLRKLLDKVGTSNLSPKNSVNELSSNNSLVKELSKQIEGLQKQVKELNKIPKIPVAKAVKNLSTPQNEGFSMIKDSSSEGVKELAQQIFKMRGW